MKSGKTIVELAQEIQRQAEQKTDYVAPTKRLFARVSGQAEGKDGHAVIAMEGEGSFPLTQRANRQLTEWAGIPAKYADKMMLEAPELWQRNVNHWLANSGDARMLRTLDGVGRAVLSDKYRRLDNNEVAAAALPIFLESKDMELVSCDVTADKLYIKALFPKVEAEVSVGDVVQAGVVVTNSEVGAGALQVQPLIYRLVCTNGMVSNDARWRKLHLGGRVEAGDSGYVVLRDETAAAQDKALLMTLQYVVRSASGETFQRVVQKMREADGGPTIEKPTAAVEKLAKKIGLKADESEGILERLIRGQNYSQFGAMNAVTNLANTADTYDRASELEVMGGRVLDLPASQWREIAQAA